MYLEKQLNYDKNVTTQFGCELNAKVDAGEIDDNARTNEGYQIDDNAPTNDGYQRVALPLVMQNEDTYFFPL